MFQLIILKFLFKITSDSRIFKQIQKTLLATLFRKKKGTKLSPHRTIKLTAELCFLQRGH